MSPLLKLLSSVSSLAILGYGAAAHANRPEDSAAHDKAIPVVRIDAGSGSDTTSQFSAAVDDFVQMAQIFTPPAPPGDPVEPPPAADDAS